MKNNQNIVLIGFMGTGKTTLGERLATQLRYDFVDMDAVIEQQASTTIADMFSAHGEAYFRLRERNCCKLVSLYTQTVIATGGGIVKDESNIHTLKNSGLLIYLKSSEEKILANLATDTSRPLLQTADKQAHVRQLLSERSCLYEAYSDAVLEVSALTIDEATARLYTIANTMRTTTRKGTR